MKFAVIIHTPSRTNWHTNSTVQKLSIGANTRSWIWSGARGRYRWVITGRYADAFCDALVDHSWPTRTRHSCQTRHTAANTETEFSPLCEITEKNVSTYHAKIKVVELLWQVGYIQTVHQSGRKNRHMQMPIMEISFAVSYWMLERSSSDSFL